MARAASRHGGAELLIGPQVVAQEFYGDGIGGGGGLEDDAIGILAQGFLKRIAADGLACQIFHVFISWPRAAAASRI